MSTDKERLAILETNIVYIKDTVCRIDQRVEDLNAFRFKVLGASSVIAGIISFVIAAVAR
jgi:hypothetical protein